MNRSRNDYGKFLQVARAEPFLGSALSATDHRHAKRPRQAVAFDLERCGSYSLAGSMEAKRPRLPRSANLTRPVTLAKRVSSEPMPTLRPGLMRVPRWPNTTRRSSVCSEIWL